MNGRKARERRRAAETAKNAKNATDPTDSHRGIRGIPDHPLGETVGYWEVWQEKMIAALEDTKAGLGKCTRAQDCPSPAHWPDCDSTR